MKLSDYIADFLVKNEVHHVFVVSGGAAVHLIDSVAKHPKCTYICAQHEQHAGAEADGYARISNNLGAVIVTSGPGGTNLTTSIANAYYDSIPVIFLCGQVATFRLKKSSALRQRGFQETDIVSLFKPITKYAAQLKDPKDIAYELEKAVFIAKTDRPGPVVLDIPDDLGRSEIDLKKIRHFKVSKNNKEIDLAGKVMQLNKMIEESKRPVIIAGAGVGLSQARDEMVKFAQKFAIPVAHTFGGADIMPSSHRLNIGTIGVAGVRSGNFAVQTADLIITVGTRLSQMVTGGKQNLFARYASKVMIDIDGEELYKFSQDTFLIDLSICSDAKKFLKAALRLKKRDSRNFARWLVQIKKWEKKYPICPSFYYQQKRQIEPHVFVKTLSQVTPAGTVITADTGANLCWVLQTWEAKINQRIISAWSHTPMGYALPAAIGAAFASRKDILCLIGDGGLMMCLQELGTVARHNLPIKIFIFNNHGHSIQKQTLTTWLDARYEAVDYKSGLFFPDFAKVGEAFGIPTQTIRRHFGLKEKLGKILKREGPFLVNVEIDPDARIVPMLRFGAGLEDLEPKLAGEEIAKIMSIVNHD